MIQFLGGYSCFSNCGIRARELCEYSKYIEKFKSENVIQSTFKNHAACTKGDYTSD